MKKYLIYIPLFILFSCDSINQLGVEEFQENFNYYDYVAYGWVDFINGNYDSSISYFQEALLLDDIDEDGIIDNMHHSAYVGLSWALTYKTNTNLHNIDNIENNEERDEAIKYLCYYMNDQGEWNNDGDCEGNVLDECGECVCDNSTCQECSDCQALSHYDINVNEMGLTFCEQDYCCTDCYMNDRHVALMYYYAYKFDYFLLNDDTDGAEEYYNLAISSGLKFLSSTESISLLDENLDYDILNGKPNIESNFSLKRNNIIALIAQLYLKNEEYDNAAGILINGNVCDDLTDINTYTVQSIIDCLENL